MKYYNNLVWMFLFLLLLAGCDSYVDIKTQGSLVPQETSNYRYLLNNTEEWETGPNMCDIASDDVSLLDGSSQVSSLGSSEYYAWWLKVYTWQPEIYPVGGYYNIDFGWKFMYNTITYANVVINEVLSSKGGTQAEKEALVAEALVHRADAYLMLVNMYAKPYNSETANSDLGVPLMLVVNTSQPLIRKPVQEIYNQIILDLTRALPALPDEQEYTTLPSKPSAYGELARTYLCMGDYEKANLYADSALIYRNTLNDLSTITAASTENYPQRIHDPEILLSKVAYGGISSYSPTAMRLSQSLLNLLGTKDKRYTLFTATSADVLYTGDEDPDGRCFYRDYVLNEARNIGPSVPEMMLIKAEYYARNGNPDLAMDWVNKLRVKRFAEADYAPLEATDSTDALIKVINERHREFFCRMLRWWDMRRLKDDPLFQMTLTRTLNGTTYTLDHSSNRYVFPIASYQVLLNPEMIQNP